MDGEMAYWRGVSGLGPLSIVGHLHPIDASLVQGLVARMFFREKAPYLSPRISRAVIRMPLPKSLTLRVGKCLWQSNSGPTFFQHTRTALLCQILFGFEKSRARAWYVPFWGSMSK